jgi:hypothetical protein
MGFFPVRKKLHKSLTLQIPDVFVRNSVRKRVCYEIWDTLILYYHLMPYLYTFVTDAHTPFFQKLPSDLLFDKTSLSQLLPVAFFLIDCYFYTMMSLILLKLVG